jgi:SAM-dependent methyltransferase
MPVAEKPFDAREYWESRLASKWGLHGVGHISYGKPYNEWLYRVRKQVFLRQVNRLSINLSEANVLDVGSGTGFWLDVWRSFGVKNVVGSDLTRVAVDNLRSEKPGMDIRQIDITERASIAGMEGRFDVVSAFDVLFHITDEDRLRSALENVSSLLRAGGWFLFSDSFLHTKSKHAAHEVDRTLDDFARELKTNKLEIRQRVPVFVVMNTPIDARFEFVQLLWRVFMLPVRLIPALGHVYGAVLYPLEIFLTDVMKESPATEMMICQRIQPG